MQKTRQHKTTKPNLGGRTQALQQMENYYSDYLLSDNILTKHWPVYLHLISKRNKIISMLHSHVKQTGITPFLSSRFGIESNCFVIFPCK